MARSMVGVALVILGLMLSLHGAEAASSRVWVSGVGNDTGACSRSAPCATFAFALTQVLPGGEVACLDTADFGPASITTSLTINCMGAATGTITVNAGSSDTVTIQGLAVTGTVDVTGSGNVNLDNMTVQGGVVGINAHSSGFVRVNVSNSLITRTTTGVQSSSSSVVRLNGNTIVGNVIGINPNGGPLLGMSNSEIENNAINGTKTGSITPQ